MHFFTATAVPGEQSLLQEKKDSVFEVCGKRQLSWLDVASHLQKGLRFRV